MRRALFPAFGLLLAACSGGLPPKGASAPYVPRYPDPIAVTMPATAPSITQQFRAPASALGEGREWSDHNGLDVHAPIGTPVLAAAPGRVVQSHFDPAYGNVVMIDHGGGHWTRYAHMQRREVSAGATVSRGAGIGALGATGVLSGGFPHLHFELWAQTPAGRRAIDPNLLWAGGAGRVTCLDQYRAGERFALIYPVPCD
ncbi:M23 family metallopeptidase [Shimia sp. FJ5]|uniref:M23 family metallopeptidase n=1 Tax=Shimia sp. FJ5 TaxID=3079054 RepID=UPI00262BF958|nr:M23 family metallopeptidase [Shimia sp. FJ5]MDV4143787.1 M23 family metallopeptidase [Shimia sp. FJ5]